MDSRIEAFFSEIILLFNNPEYFLLQYPLHDH